MRKQDIQQATDISQLVVHFYERLLGDAKIAYIFTEVSKINLEEHLPIIASFWESSLLGSGDYRGNAMRPHLDLHRKSPLTDELFEVWLGHWSASIDALFAGAKAEEAKTKAKNIAALMQFKVSMIV
jgi:hemoglobin